MANPSTKKIIRAGKAEWGKKGTQKKTDHVAFYNPSASKAILVIID
jgi:hypothetical protein